MKQIPLTQGQFALVDDADYDWLNQYKWYAHKRPLDIFCVGRQSSKINGKQYTIKMHRQILGLEKGDKREGDHRNHNTLDNQRSNLRICTSSQNKMNRRSFSNTSSQYKGVSWDKAHKKWMGGLRINGKTKYIGRFTSEKATAEAYDKAATQEFGEFAYLNFPLTIIEKVLQ